MTVSRLFFLPHDLLICTLEMIEFATKFAKMESTDLSTEERNVLSVSFKNVVGSRRAAWRVLTSIEQKELKKDNKGKDNVEKIRSYKSEIEKELLEMCNDILSLLKDHLIKNATNAEGQVFYKKMEGDYHRYIAEFSKGSERENSKVEAERSY